MSIETHLNREIERVNITDFFAHNTLSDNCDLFPSISTSQLSVCCGQTKFYRHFCQILLQLFVFIQIQYITEELLITPPNIKVLFTTPEKISESNWFRDLLLDLYRKKCIARFVNTSTKQKVQSQSMTWKVLFYNTTENHLESFFVPLIQRQGHMGKTLRWEFVATRINPCQETSIACRYR